MVVVAVVLVVTRESMLGVLGVSEGMRPGKVGVVAPVSVFGLSLVLVLVLVLVFASAFVFAIHAPPRVLALVLLTPVLFSFFLERRRRH